MENEVQIQSLVKKLLNIYNAYKWSKTKLHLRKKKYLTKTKKGEHRLKETSEIDTEIETRCHQRNIFVFTQTLPDCRKLKSYLTDPRKTKSSSSLHRDFSSPSSSTDFRSDPSYQWVCKCDSNASLQPYGNYHSVNVCTCPSCCCKRKKKYGTINKKSITEIKGVKNNTIAVIPKSLERLDETTITNAEESKEVQVPPEYAASTSRLLVRPYDEHEFSPNGLLGCDCKCEHNRRSIACQNSPGYCRICSTITFIDSSTPTSTLARKSLEGSTSSSSCSCPCEPTIINKGGNCKCCSTNTGNSCRQVCIQTTDKFCCCNNRKQSVGTEIQRDKILIPTQYAEDVENNSLVQSDMIEGELMPDDRELPSLGDRYRSSIAVDPKSKEKLLQTDRRSTTIESRSHENFLNGDRRSIAIESRSQEKFLNGDRRSSAMESQNKFVNGDRYRKSSVMESRSKENFLNGDRHRSNIGLESQSRERISNGNRNRSAITMESRSTERILNGDRNRSALAMESRSKENFNEDRYGNGMPMESRSKEQLSNVNRTPSETFSRRASMGLPSASGMQRTVEDENRPFWADFPKDFLMNLKSCECTCPRCLGIDKMKPTQATSMYFEQKIKDYYADLSQCMKNIPTTSTNGYTLQNKSSELGTIDEGVNTYNSAVVQTYTSSVGNCRQANECCTCSKSYMQQSRVIVGGPQSRTAMSQMNVAYQRQQSQLGFNNDTVKPLPACGCFDDDIFAGIEDDIGDTEPFPGLNDTTKEEIRDLLKTMEESLVKESRTHKKNLTGIMKQLTKQAGEIKELKVHVKGVMQAKALSCQEIEKKLRKMEELRKKEERQRKEKKRKKQKAEKEKKEKEKAKAAKKAKPSKEHQSETCCKCDKKPIGCCGQCCANRCCGCCGTCCGGCCVKFCDCCCSPCERCCPCCCGLAECCDTCWSCGCFSSKRSPDSFETQSHKCKCR